MIWITPEYLACIEDTTSTQIPTTIAYQSLGVLESIGCAFWRIYRNEMVDNEYQSRIVTRAQVTTPRSPRTAFSSFGMHIMAVSTVLTVSQALLLPYLLYRHFPHLR